VLAVVGEARIVDASAFRRRWKEVTPPVRPDSLTPQGARRFLDLLIDREALAERALREAQPWTPGESAAVAGLADRLVLRMALDSALAGEAASRAARGAAALDDEALGVAVRESTVARLQPTYDDVLLTRLARAFAALPRPSADSSLASRMRAQGAMPTVEAEDQAGVVARSDVGPYTTDQMLDAWKKLDPLYRPRIDTADQLRDLVGNGLFERALRREAERHHLSLHPRVVEALQRQREYLAVKAFVGHEVYARIPTDLPTLRRFYDREPDAWNVPTRLRVVRLLLPERREAVRMAVRLRDAAEADTLVRRGLRQGVDYQAEVTATSDSTLFAAALRSGTGTVLGPDSVVGGWRVVRVEALLPSRRQAFEEVRNDVRRAWSDLEGSRRMQELIAAVRKRTRLVVNEPGIARLLKEGIKPTAGRGS
jgi:parvulin-like peptidyl-prolyl cis-trans isomerase-like protein